MRRLLGIRANTDGPSRTETFLGKEYTVVPVVALVEGVLRGMASEGPELALADEFGLFPSGWNGRPLVMDHPVNDEGTPISANSPDVLPDYQIGFIFNAHVSGKKLLMEAWVENKRAEKLNANSKNVMSALEAGEMIEVSTGYFAQIEEAPEGSNYNGEEYDGIQRNIVPDHLAFLSLGSTGACSNADGCGAPRINAANSTQVTPQITFRVNCEECGGTCGQSNPKGPSVMTKPSTKTKPTPTTNLNMSPAPSITSVAGGQVGMARSDASTVSEGATSTINPPVPGVTPVANDQYATVEDYEFLTIEAGKIKRKRKNPEGYSRGQAALDIFANSFPDGMMDFDAEKFVQEALEADPAIKYPYVVGLTQSKVIYSAYDENYDYDTYQRSYTVAEGGKVTLGSDVQQVMLTTSIVVMDRTAEVSANRTDPKGDEPEDNEEKTMANGKTPEATPQANSAPASTEPKVHTVENEHGTLEVTLDADGTPKSFKLTPKANTASAPTPKAQSFEELLANAKPELQETLNSALKLHAQKKTDIITALSKSGRCKFTEDQLKSFSMDMLENLVELAAIPTFQGQATPTLATNAGGDDSAPPAPLVFEVKKPSEVAQAA